ncbi:hypothetical protein AAHH67_10045 [Niallia circulans]
MRIPPYYKNQAVQRFFAGMVIGGVISWCIFVFIFGVWQERYSSEIKTQKATIEDLEREKKYGKRNLLHKIKRPKKS